MYKVIMPGKNIKYRRGEGYEKSVWKNLTWKREMGSNILPPLRLRLWGRITRGERVPEHFGKITTDKKIWMGNILRCLELYTTQFNKDESSIGAQEKI